MVDQVTEYKKIQKFKEAIRKSAAVWRSIIVLLPLTVLTLIIINYYGKWLQLHQIIQYSVFLFFIMCFVWWGWILYKIIQLAGLLLDMHVRFSELTIDILHIRKSLHDKNPSDTDNESK